MTGDDELEAFWELARHHARLNAVPGYFGPTTLEVLLPPAFALGETPEAADAALATLLSAGRATLRTPLADLPGDRAQWPAAGFLGIVVDGAGHPAALVATERVEVGEAEVVEHLAVRYRRD